LRIVILMHGLNVKFYETMCSKNSHAVPLWIKLASGSQCFHQYQKVCIFWRSKYCYNNYKAETTLVEIDGRKCQTYLFWLVQTSILCGWKRFTLVRKKLISWKLIILSIYCWHHCITQMYLNTVYNSKRAVWAIYILVFLFLRVNTKVPQYIHFPKLLKL